GGEEEGWRWDAVVASPGCLLADLVSRKRRLGWLDTLSLLEQLAEELMVAGKDGTLPDRLSVEQVWVQPGGRVLLLDLPPRPATPVSSPLDLLRQTAALALEGQARAEGQLSRAIHAPVPGHAGELLDRLMSGQFDSLMAVREALAAAHEHPEEISPPGRAFQMALAALALLPGLVMLFGLGPMLSLAAFGMCVEAE